MSSSILLWGADRRSRCSATVCCPSCHLERQLPLFVGASESETGRVWLVEQAQEKQSIGPMVSKLATLRNDGCVDEQKKGHG